MTSIWFGLRFLGDGVEGAKGGRILDPDIS
jgi:hypothetical protein